MVPIPEGVERDEEEPKDDELDVKIPAGTEVKPVKFHVEVGGKKWVHADAGELDMIE